MLRRALPTSLLLAALLCLPARGRAFAEVCTLPVGSYAWTAPCEVGAGSISGCDCNAEDPDRWRIPAGAEVACSEGTLAFTHPEAEIAIEAGGALALSAGCALAVPGGGLGVDGALRLRGKALTFGDASPAFSADALAESPDPGVNTALHVSQVIHCPGSDGGTGLREDCEASATTSPGSPHESGLCFPEDALHYAWLAQIRAGDVLAFWDPTGGLEPPRDVNAFYRIAGVRGSCLIANLLQGGDSTGYGSEKRGIRELVLSADYAAGERRVAVGTGEITADEQGVARWLTCQSIRTFPDGSQIRTDHTQKITRVDDDPAGDVLELLPGGFERDLPAGTHCFVDYGWARGDALSVWRPAVLADGTADLVGDSGVDCNGGAVCDFDFALLQTRGPVVLFPDSDLDDAWLSDAGTVPSGFALSLVDWTAANVSQRVQITSHASPTAHSVSIDGEDFEGGTLIDWHIRHSEDDYFVPNNCRVSGSRCLPGPDAIRDQLLVLRRLRVGYMGCSGGSCSIIDANSSAGSGTRAFHVDLDGLLAEDPSGEQNVASSFYQGRGGSWELRNLAFIAAEHALLEDFGGSNASEQNVSLDNVYDIARDVGTFSTEILGPVRSLSNVSLVETRMPAPSAMLRGTWPFGARWERILVLDPRNNHPALVSIRDAGAPVVIRDLAIVGFDRSAGTGGVAIEIRAVAGEKDPVQLEDVSLVLRPDSRAAQVSAILFDGDDAAFDALRELRGLLVANFAGEPAGSPATILSAEDLDGVSDLCMQGNESDGDPFPGSGIGGTLLRDAGLIFVDPARGDFRLAEGSPGAGLCGARSPGASDMWALRVLHHDPYRSGDSWKDPARCGDGAIDPGEECDDADLAGQDGCSATCETEDFLRLPGIAMGGFVALQVDGHAVRVDTLAGQSGAQVAHALALQISGLDLPGVTASADGVTLWSTGEFTAIAISDPGLSPPREIPTLPAPMLLLLACLLALLALAAQRRAGAAGASGSSSSQLR